MKRNALLLLLVTLGTFLLFQSCRKDKFLEDKPTSDYHRLDMTQYDEFGPKLEEAVDRALKDENFRTVLLIMTQKRPLGDFEVLMSDFLNYESSNEEQIKDILLSHSSNLFSKEELDEFLTQYPSLIIATRGSLISWAEGSHTAPTVFVPSNFKEKELSITATKDGTKQELDLSKPFENAVIVLHLSERHDKTGSPLIDSDLINNNSLDADRPGVNLSDRSAGGRSSCNPEPTSCTAPILTGFEARIVNGGIRLEYNITNFPASLCSWGRIQITRLGPDIDGDGNPDVHIIHRRANQFNIFYDNTALPNTEYTYILTARVSYISSSGWVTCHANGELEQSVIANDVLPRLATFIGENKNNASLKYNWYPPSGLPVTQYRLRRATGSGYDEIPGSPVPAGSNNFAFYNHLNSDRGNLVEMQIQYRTSSGFWSGDYFDRTYASYRNPNQPLYWYGVYMPNVEDYELSLPGDTGESILYGAPEVRLFAIRGTGNISDRQAIQEQHIVIFTKSVCDEGTRIRIRPTEWTSGGWFNLDTPGEYFTDISMKPVDIIGEWDNYLVGTSVKVILSETDASEVNPDEWTNENIQERELKAELGYKKIYDVDSTVVEIDSITAGGDTIALDTVVYDSTMLYTSIGVESSWTSTESITYKYPQSDVNMGTTIIRYHYPFMIVSNKNLFGYNYGIGIDPEKADCELLQEYLE